VTTITSECIVHAEALPLDVSFQDVMHLANRLRKTVVHLLDETDAAPRFRTCTACQMLPVCTQSMTEPATFLRVSAAAGQGEHWESDSTTTVFYYGHPYKYVGAAAHSGAHWVALLATDGCPLFYDDMQRQGQLSPATPAQVSFVRGCATIRFFVRVLDEPACDSVVLTQHVYPDVVDITLSAA
jgi:hypothetical protein